MSLLNKRPTTVHTEEAMDSAPEMRSLAAAAIREHANSHPALFERAERLRERAERLQNEGTPSDTAYNRAERAESEVAVELSDLRARFSKALNRSEREDAFDQEVQTLYPAIQALYR